MKNNASKIETLNGCMCLGKLQLRLIGNLAAEVLD